jgi:methyl-accepting chemotaxis protein
MSSILGLISGRSISVAQKLMLIVGFCIAVTCAIAGFGIYQMNQIGGEIAGIAKEDIPMTNVVTKITVDQLEQGILLERMLRVAGIKTEEQGGLAKIEEEVRRVAAKTTKAIKDGEKLAAHSIVLARSHGNEKAAKEFEGILKKTQGRRS